MKAAIRRPSLFALIDIRGLLEAQEELEAKASSDEAIPFAQAIKEIEGE